MNVQPMTPLTNVRILRNVPLDNTYNDTLTFNSVSAQVSYFQNKTKHILTDLGPVRMQNAIRVPLTADDLYDCNYIMFQNSNFNNKWFYAFITQIEFANTNMCLVHFELDVWQTWYFDITIKECMVEREHTNDDTIGSNLVPENLETGDYVQQGVGSSAIVSQGKSIVVATTVAADGTSWSGGNMIHGTFSGCGYLFYPANDAGVSAINKYLKKLADDNKSNAIVSIFMAWRTMYGDTFTLTDNAPNRPTSLDGYTPRNNKLFTSPYVKLITFDGAGSSHEYEYEYFNGQPLFEVMWDLTPNPSIYITPTNYRKGRETERMCTTGFPQCSFNIDTYKAWIAQNGGVIGTAMNFGSQLVGDTLGGIGSAMSGNPLAVGGSIASVVTDTYEAFKQVDIHRALPPTYSGTNSPSALMANDQLYPHYCPITIRREFAQRIDEFFDRFGYATNRLKVPNIKGRPSWNYVKTKSCTVVGSVPFNDIDKIKASLNAGITFWHGDYVGDYSRANK